MGSESLARAMQGGLTYDSASWDKLTAMALGSVANEHRTARESLLNSLGVSLLGFKVAMRPDLYKRAVDDLRDCLRWRLKDVGRPSRLRLAKAVISEWVVDACPTCSGAGHVFDGFGVERVCPTCAGTKKRRYTDEERLRAGVQNQRHMDTAHAMVSFAVGFAIRQATERLK